MQKKKYKAELKVQCNPNTNKEKPARVTSWMCGREKGSKEERGSNSADQSHHLAFAPDCGKAAYGT